MFLLDELAKMLMDQEQLLPGWWHIFDVGGELIFCWSKIFKNPTESPSQLWFLLSNNCCFLVTVARVHLLIACAQHTTCCFLRAIVHWFMIGERQESRIESGRIIKRGILKLVLYKNPWFGKTANLNPSLSVKKKHSGKNWQIKFLFSGLGQGNHLGHYGNQQVC